MRRRRTRRRERDLVNKAKVDSLRGLRTECDRAKQAADPDPDATQARVHIASVSSRCGPTVTSPSTSAQSTKAQQIAIRAAIERKTDQLFHARPQGRPARAARGLRHGRLRSDLQGVARRPRHARPTPTAAKPTGAGRGVIAILRLDYETLAADKVTDGQVCEIDGLGPIDLATARSLLPDSLLYLVITKNKARVPNVINWARGPTRDQEIALLWQRAGRCRITACDHPRLQHDHTIGWAQTHHTDPRRAPRPLRTPPRPQNPRLDHRDHPDGTITIHPPARRVTAPERAIGRGFMRRTCRPLIRCAASGSLATGTSGAAACEQRQGRSLPRSGDAHCRDRRLPGLSTRASRQNRGPDR